MHEREVPRHQVRTWLRHQLIGRAYSDRRVRLLIRVIDSEIVQYDQDHQQKVGAPRGEAVRWQMRRLLTECQVNVRLTELIEELRYKGNLEFPPSSQSLPGPPI